MSGVLGGYSTHSRYLSHRFVSRWQSHRPQDAVVYRDLGQRPPSFINHDWVASAFTPDERREPWMKAALAESDELVDELIAADIVVIKQHSFCKNAILTLA